MREKQPTDLTGMSREKLERFAERKEAQAEGRLERLVDIRKDIAERTAKAAVASIECLVSGLGLSYMPRVAFAEEMAKMPERIQHDFTMVALDWFEYLSSEKNPLKETFEANLSKVFRDAYNKYMECEGADNRYDLQIGPEG